MKAKFGREMLLLTLPVLMIGGVGLFSTSKGRAVLPNWMKSNPLNPGPMRVELSPFHNAEVSAFDASRGIDWATQTTAQTRGNWNIPKGWKETGRSMAGPASTRIVYRQGNRWQSVPQNKSGVPHIFLGLNVDSGIWTLSADLDGLPGDASEVRLRGEFKSDVQYKGAIPTGWKVPANLQIAGAFPILVVKSEPFDVQIKGPEEPLPSPHVSREPEVELVRAAWFTEAYTNGNKERFFLLLRHTTQRNWPARAPLVQKVRVFDATSRELPLFDKNGTGKYPFFEASSVFNQDLFSPEMPQNEFVAPILSDDTAPRGGWSQVKQPIDIEMEISDGQCWPLKARITLKHETAFDQKKFGTPEASKIP